MNARTDFLALEEPSVAPNPAALGQRVARWRTRLRTWRRPHHLMLAALPHAPGQARVIEAATQAFAEWAARHEGASVDIALSSHFMLMAVGEAGPGANAQALREQACARWTHYLDQSAEGLDADWCVQTSLDGGRAPVALACALPRPLVEGLQRVARQHGLKLLALRPWWAEALQQAWRELPSPAGLPEGTLRRWAWREGDWQTRALVALHAGQWVLQTLVFLAPDQADEADLADAWGDAATDAPGAAVLAVSSGDLVSLVDVGSDIATQEGAA